MMNVKRGISVPINHLPDPDGGITLSLLKAVEQNAELTQRSLASQLGIALGLVNAYLKRCIKKGLIKTRQVPRNRYVYYLTPKGFSEKSQLAAEFLYQSLSLFRQAHGDYRAILDVCAENRWQRLCLCGCSDLAEIVFLLCAEYDVEILGIYDPVRAGTSFHGRAVTGTFSDVAQADAWIVTTLLGAQGVYDGLVDKVDDKVVLAPDLLDIRRKAARTRSR